MYSRQASRAQLILHGLVGRSSKLLMTLASTVILGSGSRWNHYRIFLSHDSTSQETHYGSVTKISRLTQLRERLAVYCENHTLCAYTAQFYYVKAGGIHRNHLNCKGWNFSKSKMSEWSATRDRMYKICVLCEFRRVPGPAEGQVEGEKNRCPLHEQSFDAKSVTSLTA
jgi:hypothetical protein